MIYNELSKDVIRNPTKFDVSKNKNITREDNAVTKKSGATISLK